MLQLNKVHHIIIDDGHCITTSLADVFLRLGIPVEGAIYIMPYLTDEEIDPFELLRQHGLTVVWRDFPKHQLGYIDFIFSRVRIYVHERSRNSGLIPLRIQPF